MHGMGSMERPGSSAQFGYWVDGEYSGLIKPENYDAEQAITQLQKDPAATLQHL